MRRILCAAAALAVACAHAEPFALRGELDRERWLVRPCGSDEAYRLLLSSEQAFDFARLESELGADDPAEPLWVEFRAVPLASASAPFSTVGVDADGPFVLRRGSCADAPRQESSR